MKNFDQEIIFIYNAKSDVFSVVSDFAHKIFSPSTYPCSLCQLTHGHVGVNKKWASFLETIPYNKRFLHKDEALEVNIDLLNKQLPIILVKKNTGELYTLLNASELGQLTSVDDLIERIKHLLNK
ncbi:GTPase [Muricauda ruestringensis]|uniref:GTPase n=1 Tax=Flagellimonas ruestringensis TaxID=111501 RepID=UPI001CD3F619|nr:GTPase [Allomuricauda ruestringensis]MCA0959753.1 GTPase [Allomuricauda ruestringensis]